MDLPLSPFHDLLVSTVGAINIYLSDAETSKGSWVGYEIITAIGVGLALQKPMIANQASVTADDLGPVTVMTLFFENVGTSLFIATEEAAFTSGLIGNLVSTMPHIDPQAVLHTGVPQIRDMFSEGDLEGVLSSYLYGCKISHIISVTCGVIASLISFSNAGPAAVKEVKMAWKKIHTT